MNGASGGRLPSEPPGN